MNSNKYIKKKKKRNKKRNRISQHLDILHWVMGLLHGRAWAGGDGAAGCGAGPAALDLSGPASADLSRCTAWRSSRLTPAILTLSPCLLLWAPAGQRLFWKWHSGSRTNSKGATRTEGALMENVHPLNHWFHAIRVCPIDCNSFICSQFSSFFLRALNN